MTNAARKFRHVGRFRRGPQGPIVFTKSARSTYQFSITGTTRNGAGAALPGCIVKLFDVGSDTKIAETVSDSSGNFTTNPPTNAGFYWIAAFDPSGNPAGVSVPNLVAT